MRLGTTTGAWVPCWDDEDPVDVGDDSDSTFYAEREHGELADEASYMSHDEARFVIVRELTRLKESRGLGE